MSPSNTAAIEVTGLVKRYRKAERAAVNGVDIRVGAGEFFALLGPNGAGKTTTISVLTTTLQPSAGTVRIAGYDALREPAQVRQRIGIIFQQPSLDLNLTGEHNVRLHAQIYGLVPYRPSYRSMPKSYRDQVDALAELLGIKEAIFKPVRTLSGGMKRKLEILRSLLHAPSVLFLDEPTAGLDPASRRDLWTYLRGVQQESGTTVFLTTHYIEEVEGADRVCVINDGRVVAEGTPNELAARLAGAGYVVLDAEDRDALGAELRRRQVRVEGSGPFSAWVEGEALQRLLRGLRTPLSVVRTHAPTLEDAYLDIVGREGS